MKTKVTDIEATGTRDDTTYLRGDGSWATPPGGGGGGIPEAPEDGKTYGRKDAAWAEITGGGGGGGSDGDGSLYEVIEFSGVSSVDVESFAGLDDPEVRLVFDFTVSADGVRPQLQYKLNGSYKASNYRYSLTSRASSGTTTSAGDQDGAYIKLLPTTNNFTIGNDAGNHCVVDATIFSPNADDTWKLMKWITVTRGQTDSFIPVRDGAAIYDGTDATSPLEGVRLTIESGTITGKVYVFRNKRTGGSTGRVKARYWRVRNLRENGTNDVGLTELRFLSSGGVNLATGGTPMASSNFSATYTAAKAFDGVTTGDNGWYAEDSRRINEWIGYDFGEAVEPHSVEIFPYSSLLSDNMQGLAVDYSVDNLAWHELCSFKAGAWSAGVSQVFELPARETPVVGSGGWVEVLQSDLNGPSTLWRGKSHYYTDVLPVSSGDVLEAMLIFERINGEAGAVAISGDGDKCVYSTRQDDDNWVLYRFDSSGGSPVLLVGGNLQINSSFTEALYLRVTLREGDAFSSEQGVLAEECRGYRKNSTITPSQVPIVGVGKEPRIYIQLDGGLAKITKFLYRINYFG